MKLPDKVNIENFSYDLPPGRIAQYPLKDRDSSKLLYYNKGVIQSYNFHDLPGLLYPDNYLVFNDTKVIMARLRFQKKTGAEIEIFLLEPYSPSDYSLALNAKEGTVWKCLVGNARKWRSGFLHKKLTINQNEIILEANTLKTEHNYRLIMFTWDNKEFTFSEIISSSGLTPIPPYLNREAEKIDRERYQTIYSGIEGSVAAPTAGLHFTTGLISRLKGEGIQQNTITLHVGAGTFLPVKGTDALRHDMHIEHFSVSKSFINEYVHSGKKIIAVGTTSLRAIETLYWLGVKLFKNKLVEDSFFLDQYEAYHNSGINLTGKQSFEVILEYMEKANTDQFRANTKIMIMPGYSFKLTEGLITNFHQPYSTLLLLVAAFIGEDWRRVYNYALQNNFRFLSYGDSSLLIK